MPHSRPKVSVIMPSYNAENTIKESICSVIAQTFLDWELIVVDDGSLDSTVPIVMDMAEHEPRICLYTLPANQGVAVARNFGLEKAVGQWIAFLDSDDVWHKEKLERQLCFADETNATITYTATSYMDAAGKRYGYVLPATRVLTYKALMRGNIMSCSSVMVRRDSMMPFPTGYMHEDYAVWLAIVKKAGHAYGLNEPLLYYRMGQATKSSNRFKSACMTYGTYRHVGYNTASAAALTLRYAVHSICKRLKIRAKG